MIEKHGTIDCSERVATADLSENEIRDDAQNAVLTRTNQRLWFARICVFIVSMIGIFLVARILNQSRDLLSAIAAGKLDGRFLLLAGGCLLSNQILCIARWRLLVGALGIPLSFRECLDLSVAAEAAHFVVPGANGGDVVKLKVLFKYPQEGVSLVASMTADRVAGVIGLLSVGTLAGIVLWPSAGLPLRNVTLATAAMLICGLLFILTTLMPVRSWLLQFLHGKVKRLNWLVTEIDRVGAGYQRHPVVLMAAALISVVSQGLTLSSLYCLGIALILQGHSSWLESLAAGPWVLISTVFPIGVTEQISQELFRALGHPGGGLVVLGYRLAHLLSTVTLVGTWMGLRNWNAAAGVVSHNVPAGDTARGE